MLKLSDDWCDCTGVEHLCASMGGCSGSNPRSDGGDPDLAHMKGVKANKNTTAWSSAAAVFAYAFGTLAEVRQRKTPFASQLSYPGIICYV